MEEKIWKTILKRIMLTCTIRRELTQAKVGDTEDRISSLPDELLIHVLSFLSTKEAVRTDILSTRWKSVWASVPTLDLSEEDFGLEIRGFNGGSNEDMISREEMFLDFVDRAVVGHRMPYLEKVAITGSYHDPSCTESWISAAIERSISNLELSIYSEERPIELPPSLFSCHTLVVLKLSLKAVLNFPVASTCFPNLKVLGLSSIIYKDDNSARNLISSCPVLEDLVIHRDEHNSLRTLNVISRSLKNLSLDYFLLQHKFVRVPKIFIDTPALESINIYDNVTHAYEVKDLSSIIEAKLQVSNFGSPFRSNYALRLYEFLRRISSVKHLSLLSWTMLSLSGVDSCSLPTFHNLKKLEFHDLSGVWNWKLVMEFLKSSPKLEVLIFQGFSFSRERLRTWEHDVPSCLVSHLKMIKIRGFLGKHEAEKVSYFLKNAKVLEKMTIETIGAEELLKLPRGSPTCEVEIC